MKTETKHTEWITNETQVDRYARIKLADLAYDPARNRPDDCGALYLAPVTWGGNVGDLALYATTNGDPILLAFVREGSVWWIPSTNNQARMDEQMFETLSCATWYVTCDDSYSMLIADLVLHATFDELVFI